MKTKLLQTRYLAALLVALVIILIVLIFGQNFVRDLIILPIEYFFWLAGLAIGAIPQYVFWVILCGLAFILVLVSLFSGKSAIVENRQQPAPRTRSERVAFWAYQVRLLGRGSYSRLRFSEAFGKLILDVLTYTGQVESRDYAAHIDFLEGGMLDVPPEILTFLRIRIAPLYDSELGGIIAWFKNIYNGLRTALTSRKEPTENPSPDGVDLDRELHKAIAYLEHELEVDSNQNGN